MYRIDTSLDIMDDTDQGELARVERPAYYQHTTQGSPSKHQTPEAGY